MSVYICFHANCFDGFGAAFAAWKKFGDEATYRACNYGEGSKPLDEIPDGSEVYVLDFSFKKDAILEARKRLKRLRVIDHHQTAKVDLEGLDDCVFDMTRSGAALAWLEFHPDREIPSLLLRVEDRDLWRFAYPDSKDVHAALGCYPFDFHEWDLANTAGVRALAAEGKVINRYRAGEVERICEKAAITKIGGYEVPLCNTSTQFSEVPHRLLELYPDAPFAASFYEYPLPNGKAWCRQFSLRGRGDFDVSVVAKKYHGGGHKSAAGFIVVIEWPLCNEDQ